MATVYFAAIVEAGVEPGYSVFFPDLPGCASAGAGCGCA
jgi:predicted RNase H-like HicB family nuclease